MIYNITQCAYDMIQWLQIMKLWLILLNILVTLMQFTNYLYRTKLDSFFHPVFYVTWDDMPAVVGALSLVQICYLCVGQYWHQNLRAFMIEFWIPCRFLLSWEILLYIIIFTRNLRSWWGKNICCALPSGVVWQLWTAVIWIFPRTLLLSSQLLLWSSTEILRACFTTIMVTANWK